MIEISAEQVERVEQILSGIPKGTERAMSNAINRGLSRTKTTARKRIKQVYAVKDGDISAASNITINKASTGNLAGFVSFNGYKIPLYKFSVKPKAPGTRQTVFAMVKRGEGGTLEDAFTAVMKSGHIGIFEREEKTRLPIEEKMGLAPAQMVGNRQVMEGLEEEVQQVVNERLEHEIDRLLNGYGG